MRLEVLPHPQHHQVLEHPQQSQHNETTLNKILPGVLSEEVIKHHYPKMAWGRMEDD